MLRQCIFEMDSISFSVGSHDDLDRVVKLNSEIFAGMYDSPPYSLSVYLERLSGKDPLILLSHTGSRLVGNSVAFPHGGEFYLWIMGVHPDFRKKGIASQLIARNEEHASKMGFSVISAKVYIVSPEMQRLLISKGFEITDVKPDAETKMNAILFRKRLKK